MHPHARRFSPCFCVDPFKHVQICFLLAKPAPNSSDLIFYAKLQFYWPDLHPTRLHWKLNEAKATGGGAAK